MSNDDKTTKNRMIQMSVPASWGGLVSLISADDKKSPHEELDIFMIRQFARLQFSSTTDLKDEYKKRFYEMCPATMSREDLILCLTKRMYVEHNAPQKVWGEIKDKDIYERVYRILQTAKGGEKVKLPQGIWLVRKYKNKNHKIQCLGDCYMYKNTYFNSLTEIAHTITGTQYSGPSFFKRRTEVLIDY